MISSTVLIHPTTWFLMGAVLLPFLNKREKLKKTVLIGIPLIAFALIHSTSTRRSMTSSEKQPTGRPNASLRRSPETRAGLHRKNAGFSEIQQIAGRIALRLRGPSGEAISGVPQSPALSGGR